MECIIEKPGKRCQRCLRQHQACSRAARHLKQPRKSRHIVQKSGVQKSGVAKRRNPPRRAARPTVELANLSDSHHRHHYTSDEAGPSRPWIRAPQVQEGYVGGIRVANEEISLNTIAMMREQLYKIEASVQHAEAFSADLRKMWRRWTSIIIDMESRLKSSPSPDPGSPEV